MKFKLTSPLGGTLNTELAFNDEALESEIIEVMKHEVLIQDLTKVITLLQQAGSTTEILPSMLASSLSHYIDTDKFYNGKEVEVEKEDE